jgi:phage major head subunit gpT-like protein
MPRNEYLKFAAKRHAPILLSESEPAIIAQAGADATDGPKMATFTMTAYTGGAMKVGWGLPVVVDLAGMKQRNSTQPIFLNHDPSKVIGHADVVQVSAQRVKVSGTISGTGPDAQEVVANAKNGFPYQASIGADVTRMEYVDDGETVNVNGKNWDGPIYIARATDHFETSFVPLGADSATSAKIVARFQEMTTMEPTIIAPVVTATATVATPVAAPDPIAELRASMAAEMARASRITTIVGGSAVSVDGVPLAAHAVSNGWTPDATELYLLKASRPQTGTPITGRRQLPIGRVIEAALCQSGTLNGYEKLYKEEELQAAHTAYKGRLGLQEAIMEAAHEGGYAGHSPSAIRSDLAGVLKAAFSTASLPGILSNVANKFLLQGFMAVENVWQKIASKRTVQDFKQATSYRLSGGMEYEEVGPSGEIKHGTVGETQYTNQAKTYGKMLTLTRQMIINDDLGALTQVPQRLGRGAALKINKVFWTEFLDNSSFFTTGNINYLSGTNTVLGIDSLTLAVTLFLNQIDPDSNPVAVAPKMLLTPPALSVNAQTLYRGTELRDTTASTKIPTINVHAGQYEPVVSTYLSNANLTGYSANAWYLLGDPSDLSVIEIAFLDGQEAPTVQEAEADFNTLGIQMRGYHDFGVKKQEYRGGVKMKGAA